MNRQPTLGRSRRPRGEDGRDEESPMQDSEARIGAENEDRFEPTPRTEVRRLPARAAYEREIVYGILDEGLVCHVGFVVDGEPFVIPTSYGREGDLLYLHGSPASRMLRGLQQGPRLCVTVTLLDGLVLARSAFHHSMNYRSAVVVGRAREVTDAEERLRALRAVVEHVVPGRWPDARRPDVKELAQTLVLALPIEEASAKRREGGPIDDEADLAHPAWAGVVPLRLVPGEAVADSSGGTPPPEPRYVTEYRRP
jgi:nitroimidazol reductase NimA-like FMN-containing flavoprotein (pyridoxamine 5'-phosphate oxidase superfamily)